VGYGLGGFFKFKACYMYVIKKPKFDRLVVNDREKTKRKYKIIDDRLLKNNITVEQLYWLHDRITA